MTIGNNETIHISLGSTANYLTSHCLNLQGLAATTSDSGSGDNSGESLCDPSVTHDVRPLDGDDGYSSHNLGASSSLKRYAYVPRTLIIDGRDSFPRWAGGEMSHQQDAIAAWSGDITTFDPSSSLDAAILDGGGMKMMDNVNTDKNDTIDDSLTRFRNAALAMGSSRFHATAPQRSASSYNTGRHVEWDDDEEEEEDEFDDNDDYRAREARRRRQESMEHKARQARKDWNRCMEDAWEETFYPSTDIDGHDEIMDDECVRSNEAMIDGTTITSDNNNGTSATTTTNAGGTRSKEREIQWHDYWMSPMPARGGYSVPLPFDTSNARTNLMNSDQSSSSWSTCSSSFDAGYRSPDSSVCGGGGSWREHVLSESLRKVLEGCDIVKGFNIFVDGGSHSSRPGGSKGCGGGAGRSNGISDILAGGGFHAGLAASLLEELSEECRSAGRWAVMVDPPSSTRAAGVEGNDDNGGAGIVDTEVNQVYRFRNSLNAGLALHGLSSNADAFLPVSIDGAYCALRSDTTGGRTASSSSTANRTLFEGSAAIALALETSTLFYRLRRHTRITTTGPALRRGRIGIQSGFYQGYSGNAGYEEFDNEPFATAPSLTYHEFLACARPSSDRRRNILELDALLRPLSYPSTSSTSGGGLSSSVLASLASSGLIIGGDSNNSMGEELQRRITRGTSIEQMMMEQQRQQYRSSRARVSSSRPVEPGEWLDDFSTKTCDGGGLLSSLSGNSIPFGMRSDHHHFALSTSLRPAKSDSRPLSSSDNCTATAFLRPMMESMGVKYRPEVSLGLVVEENVMDLTGVSSYWRSVFSDRRTSAVTPQKASGKGGVGSIESMMSPNTCASHTPILSVLGNSTRSYPRLNTISSGFVDALHSRRNMGYLSRDVMAGVIPEKDDCEEALEYCRELMDVYEPPLGSGLVGEDKNDSGDAYFDED
jgi:hypothetical protein